MSFDTQTRNRLASFVGKCRKLLCGDFKTPGGEMARLLAHYGIQDTGDCFAVDTLTHLDEPGRETARTLRAILEHKQSTAPKAKVWKKFDPAVYDLIQEQGFTVLNRLCALRMAEERKIIEYTCVSKGLQSDSFQLYEMMTGKANAEITPELRYQHFLFSLFDELSLDLGSLFDRFNPQGLLFPGTQALAELLEELNHPELASLWGEDETIGWIYQYWNSQEERKAMRDASAAPRNSRELAVRNQFFTPRYVVQFLTENTLGRTWYEMTQGKTALKDNCTYLVRRPSEVFLAEGEEAPEQTNTDSAQLSQAEQLKQPVYIPFRPLKDPREIRLLDPACGSMHFGLYAFDLFETIYSEAWELNVATLREDFPTKEALLLEMPRLIIEHNIHGVDIDPRATQIAGLALWLRAQRTWKNQKVSATDRPKVKRSNIVCAEPMPGDQDQLAEFTAKLHPAIAQMVAHIFEKMQLAGEAGSLLKIEEEITALVDEAKAAWQKIGKHEGEMFSMAEIVNADGRSGTQQILDTGDWNVSTLSSISHRDFFEKAESEIYAQLARYAETAGSGSYKRKLFANDAAHGFALIDLCSKRYEAVVMNPPFGEPAMSVKGYIREQYVNSYVDLFASFVDRAVSNSRKTGFIGVLSTEAGFFRRTLEAWRRHVLLESSTLSHMAHFGGHMLDGATVRTAAYVLSKQNSRDRSLFYRLMGKEGRDQRLIESIKSIRSFKNIDKEVYSISQSEFLKLPYAVFGYWCSSTLINSFVHLPQLEEMACVRSGLSTLKDFRFLRLSWEVPCKNKGLGKAWAPLAKGGEYSPYYDDIHLVVCSGTGFNEIYSFPGDMRNASCYGKIGLTYPRRTNKRLAPRIMPGGCAFGDKGPAIVDIQGSPWALLAILNSRPISYLVGLALGASETEGGAGANSYEVGLIQRLPIPKEALNDPILESNANTAWACRAKKDIYDESTCSFTLPFPSTSEKNSLESHFYKISECQNNNIHSYLKCLSAIDEQVCNLYRFSESDWNAIQEKGGDAHMPEFMSLEQPKFKTANASSFISYFVGSALGRWDIRFATGVRQPPEFVDPFDPIPACSPGMLQNAHGMPAEPADEPNDYPLRITWPGILVNDEAHVSSEGKSEDIVARIRDALTVIWGDQATAIEQESCDILNVKVIRDYFSEGKTGGKFFKEHLTRFSKSRRKAPLYWPLSTESGTYTLWFYYHRLSANTLYTAVEKFIDPKQEEAKETFAKLNAKQSRSQDEDKELEAAQLLVAELATFRESLLETAKFWKPDLNDGVQITAAPLWKHFRLKSWQKTLKDTWSKLEHGDYDWAHLAHSIWPERVIQKCITDRSLAIAHGHDEALWVEVTDAKGKSKWQTRQNAEDIAKELISQRTGLKL